VQEHLKEKHSQASELKMQDKENIKNIFEMMSGQHSKQLIENLYFQNDKNFERTLEQFLSGNIPKDEYKLEVIKDQQ
jgi:predicted amidophosphoribosyltransferase